MTLRNLIIDAERNADKWRSIVARGAWSQHNRTEAQAIALHNRFEGRLDGLVDAKRLMKGE